MSTTETIDFGATAQGSGPDPALTPSGADLPAPASGTDTLTPCLTPDFVRSMSDADLTGLLSRYAQASEVARVQRMRAIGLEDRVAELCEQVGWHQRVVDQVMLERDRAVAERQVFEGRLMQVEAEHQGMALRVSDFDEVLQALGFAVGLLKDGVVGDHPSVREVELVSSRYGVGFAVRTHASGPDGGPVRPGRTAAVTDGSNVLTFRSRSSGAVTGADGPEQGD